MVTNICYAFQYHIYRWSWPWSNVLSSGHRQLLNQMTVRDLNEGYSITQEQQVQKGSKAGAKELKTITDHCHLSRKILPQQQFCTFFFCSLLYCIVLLYFYAV